MYIDLLLYLVVMRGEEKEGKTNNTLILFLLETEEPFICIT